MFPLKQRKVIRGWDAHIKAGLGGGTDYVANYVELYVPFDGIIETYHGNEGGKWVRLIRSNGDRIEMAHNSRYIAPDGFAKEGWVAAITGNTGSITSGPHLHIQIIDKYGKRKDPEKYQWNTSSLNEDTMLRTYNRTIYALVAGYWMAVGTGYPEFLSEWGNQAAPPMTEAQFKAFPVHKRTIK